MFGGALRMCLLFAYLQGQDFVAIHVSHAEWLIHMRSTAGYFVEPIRLPHLYIDELVNAEEQDSINRYAQHVFSRCANRFHQGGHSGNKHLTDLHIFDTQKLHWSQPEILGTPPPGQPSSIKFGHKTPCWIICTNMHKICAWCDVMWRDVPWHEVRWCGVMICDVRINSTYPQTSTNTILCTLYV